jgi:hypothetical protein
MLDAESRLVLNTLLPPEAHPKLPSGVMQAGFDVFWQDFERTALPRLRWSVRAALFAAAWIAPLLIGRLPPLSRHSQPVREEALDAMGVSRLPLVRQVFALLKTIASLCYGANPAVRAALGCSPTPTGSPGAKAP